jgi:hypothetical protein
VGETEFKKVSALSQAVLQQAENLAETTPAPEPYAGGRYVREEPPLSSNLPFAAPAASVANTSLFKPMGPTGRFPPQSSAIKAPPPRSGFLAQRSRRSRSPLATCPSISRLRCSRSPLTAGPSALHPRRS